MVGRVNLPLTAMNMQSIIARRRDGEQHSDHELVELAKAAARHTVPDYQLSAWLMAAYLNPMSLAETASLTAAMAATGDRVDLTGLPKPWLDKHSTGGVGDKTTMALLPILAASGLTVVKMSGRGLGIAGGTLDKLQSIPGFRIDLSPDELREQALKIGLALTGQTPDLAPADKVLYALRDATATVESISLITSSVLCKKIAGGADTIVIDVKAGSGAYMKTVDRARELARSMMEVAEHLKLNLRVAITDMSQPLGSAIGNAVEVREAIAILENGDLRPEQTRFRDLLMILGGLSLHATGLAETEAAGRAKVSEVIQNGSALEKFRAWIAAQGGADIIDHPDLLPHAPVTRKVIADRSGWVSRLDAQTFGETVVRLGGGRQHKDDTIDPSVGIELHARIGSRIERGDALCLIYAATDRTAEEAEDALRPGMTISATQVDPLPLLIDEIPAPR